jgi:hypothetical protein
MRIVTSSPNTVSLWFLHLKWPTENHFTAKRRRVATSTAKVSKGKSIMTIITDDEADGSDEADEESSLPKCM